MRYLSLFSGIEATSVAWGPLVWEAAAFSEVDPSACAVLAHRYPTVPNLGDVRDIDGAALDPLGTIDLVAFGWPCQDLSVAGKRAGLRGERSGLFHEAVRVVRLLAGRNGCRWLVAENVPGLLSSDGGRDLAAVVRAITGLDVPVPAAGWGNSGVAASNDIGGWSLAWRCLDAQYFGVHQRRRRVFLVGHLGDWRRAAAVLFEPQSLWGDPPPRREAESGIAPSVTPGARRASGNRSGELLSVAGSQTARYGKGTDDPIVVDLRNMAETGDVSHTLQVGTHGTSVNNTPHVVLPRTYNVQAQYSEGKGPHAREDIVAKCLDSHGLDPDCQQGGTIVAQPYNIIGSGQKGSNHAYPTETSGCLQHKGLAATGNEAGTLIICKNIRPTQNTIDAQANTSSERRANNHAHADEAHAREVLRALREAVGEEAFQEWGLGIAASLRAAEVLRSSLYGEGTHGPIQGGSPAERGTIPSEDADDETLMRAVWIGLQSRCSPPQRESAEQLARESGRLVSLLPHQDSQAQGIMLGLWQASKGLGLLRQALSEVQEARRSADGDRPAEASVSDLRRTGTQQGSLRQALHETETGTGQSLSADGGSKEVCGFSAIRRLTPRLSGV